MFEIKYWAHTVYYFCISVMGPIRWLSLDPLIDCLGKVLIVLGY